MTAFVRIAILRDEHRQPFVVQRPLRAPYRDAAQDIRAIAEELIELIVRDGLTAVLVAN